MAATSWFRKNQKKLLGVLVVFLMVIWGIGPAAEYIVPKPAIGRILGEEITQEQFSARPSLDIKRGDRRRPLDYCSGVSARTASTPSHHNYEACW